MHLFSLLIIYSFLFFWVMDHAFYYCYFYLFVVFFFLRVFQPMMSAPDNSSLSSDQDTNQFLM